MANYFSITVLRRLQKVTPSCSVVKLSMSQRYEFDNAFDFFKWLDQFRSDQQEGILHIKTVCVNSNCLIWSINNNLPLGMSFLKYLKWENSLLRKEQNEF